MSKFSPTTILRQSASGVDSRGFTAFELVVVLFLTSILAAYAIPQYSLMSDSYDRFNARAHLLEDIKTAQAFSLAQGCRGIITIAPDAKSYTFGCDYLSYDTADPPVPDSIEYTRNLDGDVTVAASGTVIFNSRGQTVDKDDIISNITFTLSGKVEGSTQVFATGILLGTGVFSYS